MKTSLSAAVATASQILMALAAITAVVVLAVDHIIDGQAAVALIAAVTGISGGGVVAQHATNIVADDTPSRATSTVTGHAG